MKPLLSLCSAVVVLVVAAGPCLAALDPCANSPTPGIVQQKAQQATNEAIERIKDLYRLPDKETLRQCLDGISKGGWGASLGLPSLAEILAGMCNAVKSEAQDRIGSLQKQFSYELFGVSVSGQAGNSGGTNRVTINNTSGRVVNAIIRNFR